MQLSGLSILGDGRATNHGPVFRARAAGSSTELQPAYAVANQQDVEIAVKAATEAFVVFGSAPATKRAELLRAIATGLEAIAPALVERAMQETGLPQPRLAGEVGRTCGQLRLFAAVLEEGSWQNVRIDTALPDRTPLPRPDLRSMLCPLGPVVVFGASNFPLAFSTAGGDTASALAAGNPVIVKAHPAHPGTGELVGLAIQSAVKQCGLPAGIFALLYDDGFEIGKALVTHPDVQAVAFTGSKTGGRALMDLVAARPSPIPCFTEMSSINPVFLLPGAIADGAQARARGLHGSFTLGAGQFCTKPGIVFLPRGAGADDFIAELETATAGSGSFTMLTGGIADAYHHGLAERQVPGVTQVNAPSAASPQTHAVLFQTDIATFQKNPVLQEEIFGPSMLLVHFQGQADLLKAAEALEGHLTATILGTAEDLANNRQLIAILERKVGRLLFNGFPTGVEVSYAMVHGGPYPATSDSRFTSVGAEAILRFVRPRCYQNFPQAALPEILRNENSAGILRLIDGVMTRDPIPTSQS